MQWDHLARTCSTLALLVGFLLTSTGLKAETLDNPPPAKKLNLYLPAVYTEIPEDGFKTNLNIAQQIRYSGAFEGAKAKKSYPFGYKQVKADKSIRVRGWEVKDKLYIGQTRVGEEWGVGMMYTKGNFAYGLNDDGVGLVYKGENSAYRLNMEEISFEIDF